MTGSINERVHYLISPLYSTMTYIYLLDDSDAVVVDPGITESDFKEIARIIENRNTYIIHTHGHWDHILIHDCLGHAGRYATEDTISYIKEYRETLGNEILEGLKDAQMRESEVLSHMSKPEITYDLKEFSGTFTSPIHSLEDLPLEGIEFQMIPGHFKGQCLMYLKDEGVLISGDTLSPVEIPTADSLEGFRRYLEDLEILKEYIHRSHHILPGHGHPMERSEAREILDKDRGYLKELLRVYTDAKSPEDIPLPQGETRIQGDSAGFHRDNVRALLKGKDLKK